MSKERRSVSLEPDVDEYLSSEGVNASELVNRLVKNHASSGGDERSMLKLREQQLLSDVRNLRGQLNEKENELEQVRERLDEYQDKTQDVIQEAADVLVTADAENAAVQQWADKTDLRVEEFAERLAQELDEREK